jgi:hypothetical protein
VTGHEPHEVAAHSVTRRLMETLATPEHDPRKASEEYKRVHHHLIDVLDEPCWICGVRKSTLNDPQHNTRGSAQMETHHYHVEWSLANAMDPTKLIRDFPELGAADADHLRQWLDSEGQMLVLCDICHRHPYYGIHEVTYPAWVAQRWFRDDWDLVKGEKDGTQ